MTKNNPRSPRPEDRNEITLPDGRKILKRESSGLGGDSYRLKLPKKTGFSRRWVSDEQPHRLQYWVDLNWVPAVDENGDQVKPVRGGTRKDGTTYYFFPFEISEELWKETLKKFKDIDPVAKATENQNKWIEGRQTEDGLSTYSIESGGQNYNKIKEVNIS